MEDDKGAVGDNSEGGDTETHEASGVDTLGGELGRALQEGKRGMDTRIGKGRINLDQEEKIQAKGAGRSRAGSGSLPLL